MYCILFLHQTTTDECWIIFRHKLYCILFLHQTTTRTVPAGCTRELYCILFLHQTTTASKRYDITSRLYCILFLHQTTTPESIIVHGLLLYCILFLHQTTTDFFLFFLLHLLYCILFLHQTTTFTSEDCLSQGCIASSFYIKPQHISRRGPHGVGCIASSFYIKPQPRTPDTLIFGHLTASRHDTKRGGVHRGSRFDAVFTFSTNIRKIIFTEIRRCMSVQRAGARLRSDSSEANI